MRAKTMVVVAAAVLSLLSIAGRAQDGLAELKRTTPEERTRLLTDMMRARLSLSEAQVTQVREINLKYAKEMQPVLESSDRPFKEVWELRKINEGKEAELKKVLSPKQFDEYLAAKEEIRQKLEQRLLEKRAAERKTDPAKD